MPTLASYVLAGLVAGTCAACGPASPGSGTQPVPASVPAEDTPSQPAMDATESTAAASQAHWNAEYRIDGRTYRLNDGRSEVPAAPGSAATIVTRRFGNEAWFDFNSDGQNDVVFLLTQQTGGSGTFYYVVAAVSSPSGYVGSQALLLGDRIAPQTTQVREDGIIVVNYAERLPGEPYSARPSMAKSIWLKLDPQALQFGEVAQNFEGEANPAQMTLGMTTWNWIRAVDADGSTITPLRAGAFSITFGADQTFAATTDCNRMHGAYTVEESQLSFGPVAATRMFCEGSQERVFTDLLGRADSYEFTSRGELVIQLRGGGSITFR